MRRLMSTLKAVMAREMFSPGFLGLFINPFYFARKGLAADVRDLV